MRTAELLEKEAPDVNDEGVPQEPPVSKSLGALVLPNFDDPDELLKRRFLCRGGALLIVGPTGIGKSALAMQFMISWALGKESFSIKPTGLLKCLLIQAENDE